MSQHWYSIFKKINQIYLFNSISYVIFFYVIYLHFFIFTKKLFLLRENIVLKNYFS